ncbi:hypothetical protein E4T48_08069 [Aureobasidium sp. EXF-10727]|nr:hypothetical protein E4T48_08069 [Aureobasidium sp. EXF-10727]
MSHRSLVKPDRLFEEEEEEEEEDEEEEHRINNYEMPATQRHVQANNYKNGRASPGKSVSFQDRATQYLIDADGDEQMDADAANQLQTEDRQARGVGNRLTRSRSPNKRSVSGVDSHSALIDNINGTQRSTSRGPAPASALSRVRSEGQMEPTPRYSGTVDPTPPETLTPQERKDNELDAVVMETLARIRAKIDSLCDQFFRRDIRRPNLTKALKETLQDIEDGNEWEFINFCRAIAEGGGDAKTWQQVIADSTCRHGLSYGIIHRVLVQHVFKSLLFGGPPDLLARLEQMEKTQENEDGFYREQRRAEHIASYELQYRVDLNQTDERKFANLELALQISRLLQPLWDLDRENTEEDFRQFQQEAFMIVKVAAELATLMRKSGVWVLYQFGHVFKDQVADRTTMEVLNFGQMEQEYKASQGADQVLIRMVCGDPLYAFRKGGSVMAERILEKEEKEQDMSVAPELRHLPRNHYRGRLITAQDGYRAKFLAKAQVVGRLEQIGSESTATDLMDAVRLLKDEGCTPQ